MDIEALRTYCLSLSPEVEEKFPFQKFRAARDVLVFYIGGHMFCYFDINDLSRVSMQRGGGYTVARAIRLHRTALQCEQEFCEILDWYRHHTS